LEANILKKLVVIVFSISLIALVTATKEVKESSSTNGAAYAISNPINHPIQPPIG
jgi:hypothetical protein